MSDGTVTHLPGQEPLDGTDYTKVKFIGMSMDSLNEEFKIGDEALFLVRARCKGNGEQEMADGHVREFSTMKVQSVAFQKRVDPLPPEPEE